jgi:hypothetical protein
VTRTAPPSRISAAASCRVGAVDAAGDGCNEPAHGVGVVCGVQCAGAPAGFHNDGQSGLTDTCTKVDVSVGVVPVKSSGQDCDGGRLFPGRSAASAVRVSSFDVQPGFPVEC